MERIHLGKLWMHWNLLKGKDKTRSVLHLHPTYCVAAMYRGWQLNDIVKDFPKYFDTQRPALMFQNLKQLHCN